ncbi:MAG: M14 family metallopeptidase [Thermoplasmatota archaeon]
MGDAGRAGTAAIIMIIVISLTAIVCSPDTSAAGRGSWTYHSSDEISSILGSLAEDHSEICTYATAQDLLGTRDIPGGRVIPILMIGDFENSSRPYIMLIGAHHGNEPDSAETVLAFAVDLLEGYDLNADLNLRIVNGVNIAVLPVVNPYGLDNGLRVDENGEDPNRDYPFDPSESGFQSDGIPLTTAGASALHSLASRYPFSAALSYHTGSKGIFTPWGADIPASSSPDSASFNDLGRYLSRASGYDLAYGPANDFTGVSYLNGAFDDHLYGSMFMPDYLFNDTFRLPHSISTCTIELMNSKGENLEILGDPSAVWDPLGDDDGTISTGMRMSYAACELVSPSMEMDVERSDSYHRITVQCTGFTDPSAVHLTVSYPNGSTVPVHRTGFDLDPILPYMDITYDLDIGTYNGSYVISSSAHPNGQWTETDPRSFPLVEPQSILSRSGKILGDRILMEIPREIEDPVEPGGPTVFPIEILGLSDDIFTAGEDGSADLRIDLPEGESFREVELRITSHPYTTMLRYRIGEPEDFGGESVIYLPADHLIGRTSLAFLVPDLAGVGILKATLRTDNTDYNDTWPVMVVPSIKIGYFSHVTDPGAERIDLTVLTNGVRTSTSVIYGLTRDPDQVWTETGWLSGPLVSYVHGNGTSDISLIIPDVQGDVYLLISDSDNKNTLVRMIRSDFEIFASDLPAEADNHTVIFGPAVVLMSGPADLIEARGGSGIHYRVFIEDEEGETTGECRMGWTPIHMLDEHELQIIRTMALQAGYDPGELSGAWKGSVDIPDIEGRCRYYGRIEIGNYTSYAGTGFDGTQNLTGPPVISGDFIIEAEEDGEEGSRFNWIIPVVFGALIILIVAITIVRYPSHWKEPEPDEENIPIRRAGSIHRTRPQHRGGRGIDSLKGSNRRR